MAEILPLILSAIAGLVCARYFKEFRGVTRAAAAFAAATCGYELGVKLLALMGVA